MLLDIGSVFGGIGLAIVGFVIVIVVCVVILRLLAAILPSYEDRTAAKDASEGEPDADEMDVAEGAGDASVHAEAAGKVTTASAEEPELAPEGGDPPV